ncbi:membrane-associated guanylate kinase, WW and PDZ domain-containing protein 2-like isoform X2 [Heterodontus francisci]|uniref:membrane-associated guanylate kinase, WW and PDZ domain-containing protein 2-like isoform X2 n=1 Tax=Heterodontus francisci TaxID=7792 RepID=UPI00355BDE16
MLRKLFNINHWTQKTREITLCRDEQGFLNLGLLGGAEYGQFLYLGDGPGGKARHHSGKLQAGDLLLEVNEAPVPGLTLRDALGLLANVTEPVRLKTVPQGSQLNCDLRHFLKQVFTKGTADFNLQEQIRQNLYIRAVPCTTRASREGEIPGVDYHFITLSEFQALDRAGGLLESGRFDGNYYGTPVPPILPTDPVLTLDPSMLQCPRRSKSLINLEKGLRREEGRVGRDTELQGPSKPPGSTGALSNGHLTSTNTNQSAGLEEQGTKETTHAGDWAQEDNWERESYQRKQSLAKKAKDSLFPTDVSQMLGHSVFTTVVKTNNTFGFTIAGGNRPSELLQVVSIATGGPADRSGDVQIRDVIVAIDKASVLGFTHAQVVRLFQAVPEGEGAELHLRRGYPPLYNVEPHLLSEANARAAGALPAPVMVMLPVAVMQSPDGPGFTVARGAGGHARVTRVNDRRCCPDLREGDLVVKVNGQRVQELSDRQLEEVLRMHTRAGDVILLVQRAVESPVKGTQLWSDSTRCSADGSAQPQAGYMEHAGGDGNGLQRFGAGSGHQDPESPCGDGQERTKRGQAPEDIVCRRDREGSGFLAISLQTESGDKASPGASSQGDAREGDRRSRSLSAAPDVPRGSSRAQLSDSHPDQIGDQLVEINGERTLGMTHSQAVELIKQGQGKIRLVMRCGNGLVPEYGPDITGVMELEGAFVVPVCQQPPSLIPRGGTELERFPLENQASRKPESQSPPRVLSSPDRAQARKRGRLGEEGKVQARGGRPEGVQAGGEAGGRGAEPVTYNSRGHRRPGRRQHDDKGPEALVKTKPQILPEHALPQALPDTRPQALPDTRPQALPDTRPQALRGSRPQAEESSETESESTEIESESSWSSPSEDAPALHSFDEQRQMNSMIGKGLDHPGGPLSPCRWGTKEGYCAHCGSRTGSRGRLRRILAPGPWLVPGQGKLLEIIDG